MNLLTSSVSNSDQNNRISALLSPFSFPQSLEQTLASLLQKAQQTLLFCVLLSPSSMQSQLVAILQEECFTLSLYLNPSSVPPRYDSIDTHIQPASALTDFRAVSFDSEGSVAFRSASSVSLATNNHASLFLFPALLSRSCTLTLSSSSAMGSIFSLPWRCKEHRRHRQVLSRCKHSNASPHPHRPDRVPSLTLSDG